MARQTPIGGLTGIALLDERVSPATLLSADSSYGQAGPRPGDAAPADPRSLLAVQVSGAQDAALTVKALSAGMPAGRRPCRVGYYPTADGATKLRGWNPPAVLLGWSAAEYAVAASAVYGAPDAAVIPSSQKIVAVYAQGVGGAKTVSRVWSPYGTDWTAQATIDSGNVPSSNCAVAVCCLPGSERLIALENYQTDGAAGIAYYSDDAGATWTRYADGVLDVALSVTTRYRSRLRVIGDDLAYVLVGDFGGTTKLAQYASADLGASFRRIVLWSSPGGTPDVCALPGGGLGLVRTNGSGYPQFRSVGSAWDDLSGAADVAIDASIALGDVTIWAEPDGRLWVAGRGAGGIADSVYLWRSDDGGATWNKSNTGIYASTDTATGPKNLCGLAAGGGSWLLHQWNAAPSTTDDSVAIMQLGGWSTVTLDTDHTNATAIADLDQERIAFGPTTTAGTTITWAPFDEPGDCGWTATGAGADTLTAGYLQITTVAAQRYYEPPTAPASKTQVMALFDVFVNSGGSLTATEAGFEIDVSDGTRGHSVAVRASTTGFRIRDLNAAADKATITTDMGLSTQIFVAIKHPGSASAATIEVLYRRLGSAAWTVAYSGTIAVSGAITAGRLQWGAVASGTAVSGWRLACLAYGFPAVNSGVDFAASTNGSTGVWGRPCNAVPVALGDGATAGASFLAAIDGPARVAETHAVSVAYDYGADRLYPLLSPSPAEEWRSTDDTEQILAWTPGSLGAGVVSALGYSRSIVVGFLGANFRTAYLEAWDGAAWVQLGEYDGATDFSGLTCSVDGDQVVPDAASATATRYLQRAELVGGVILVDSKSDQAAYILHQEEGTWADSATVARKPRLTVDRLIDSGDCVLVSPRGILVCHGVNSDYEKYRIRIPNQTTPDGYYRLGALFVGGLVATGLPWDWGWQHELRPTFSEATDRAGVARRRQDGEPRRIWSFAWPGGAPLARLRSGTPDYLSPDASLEPLAAARDVPWLMEGLMREARSGERPCVAIQSIPLTATYATLTDCSLWVYGRLSGSVSQAHASGRVGRELVRVETLSVEEIPGAAEIPPYEAP